MDESEVAEGQIRETLGPLGVATINPPDFAGLAACVEDVRRTALDGDGGPADPDQYGSLRGRLEAVRFKHPPLYRETFVKPYIRMLDQLGETEFNRVLLRDPDREREAGLMLDIAQAILQQGEGFSALETDAFQETVSDLYDGFLSAEDRRGVEPPEHGVIPPLVKWGNPDFGPYTWPIDATSIFNVQAPVVSLPPSHRNKGLLGWATLGHETAGHDILHADDGLQAELAEALRTNLASLDGGLADYWADRVDETSSDVMGILNMGPAAAIGLVGYFRGLNAAYLGQPRLSSEAGDGPHPADILRAYLGAEVVGLLRFTGKTRWRAAIKAEADRDVGPIVLDGTTVPRDKALESCAIVARTLITHKAEALELHALGEIQNWRDSDERKVRRVRRSLRTAVPLPSGDLTRIYAAHMVAGAVVEALASPQSLAVVFDRMKELLKQAHDANPAWGPLFVRQRGDIAFHSALGQTRRRARLEAELSLDDQSESN